MCYRIRPIKKAIPIMVKIPPKILKIKPKLNERIGMTIPKTARIIFNASTSAKKTTAIINNDKIIIMLQYFEISACFVQIKKYVQNMRSVKIYCRLLFVVNFIFSKVFVKFFI